METYGKSYEKKNNTNIQKTCRKTKANKKSIGNIQKNIWKTYRKTKEKHGNHKEKHLETHIEKQKKNIENVKKYIMEKHMENK